MDGVTYSYDNNGNLLNDGVSTYSYDKANRLIAVSGQPSAYSFVYNGLGDRLQQTVDTTTTNYTLDLNNRLTQVLTDGTDTYLYGLGRIGEFDGTDWTYPLADALGSVRQLTDASGAPVMAQNYAPYGDVLESYGAESSNYGFAGEWTDGTGLQHLRARYLNTGIGRFITRDSWGGDYRRPLSLNRWGYVAGNPVNRVDPSGYEPCKIAIRYCVFTEGEYNGFTIDLHHFSASKIRAKKIIEDVNDSKGKLRAISVKGKLAKIVPYNRYYLVSLPEDASNDTVDSVGLGILMDYEFNLEMFEFNDPSCWASSKISPSDRCSTFSNEDLPSAYLGYVSEAKNLSFNDILKEFNGTSEGRKDLPDQITGTKSDAQNCFFGLCGKDNPFNNCFTPKIYDAVTQEYRNLAWPDNLLIEPIPQGDLWRNTSREVAFGVGGIE